MSAVRRLPRTSPRRTVAAVTLAGMVIAIATGCASAPASPSTAATGASPNAAPSTAPSTASSGNDSKLGIIDTRTGTGARAAARQCLYVHYVGTLANGRTFESSQTPLPNGELPPPIAFELGTGGVMPGWEKGIVGMLVGGARRLFVPYRMAYGASGRPPAIPALTDLVFDIELMAVAPPLPTSSNAPRAETARTCPAWASVNRSR